MSPRKPSVQASVKAQNRREELRRQQLAEAQRQRRNRLLGIGAAITALVLAAVAAVVWFTRDKPGEDLTAGGTPPHAAADHSGIVVNPGKAKQGAPTVALYFDYQCPWCKRLEDNIGANLESLADKGEINLEYRTMTFMDVKLNNTASSRAAVAAACADYQGIYAKYHDEAFANQAQEEVKGSEGYSDELLTRTIPAKLGLGGDKLAAFGTCYSERTTEAFVETTDDLAGKSGVTGTPTLQVNGREVQWQQASGEFVEWAQGGQSDDTVLAGLTAGA